MPLPADRPTRAGRMEIMTENAEQRLKEAREHQWLGEVSALEESLVHFRRRGEEAEKLRAKAPTGDLGAMQE